MYFKVDITDFHADDSDDTGVWILYKDKVLSEEVPCGKCFNARFDDELTDENDFGSYTIGQSEKDYRMTYSSGYGRPSRIEVDKWSEACKRWVTVGVYFPKHCPECGREITEYNDDRLKRKNERGIFMLFYKIKNNKTEVCFRSDEVLHTSEEVVKYAMDNELIEKSDKKYEAFTIFSDEYREYLLEKISDVFEKYLAEIKESWKSKDSDDICKDCQTVVYINDIIHTLCDTEASMFDCEVLESWMTNPDKIVNLLCKRLEGKSKSDYNESICDYINQGLEE